MDSRDNGQNPLHSRPYFDTHGGLGRNASMHQNFIPREGIQTYGMHHNTNAQYALMNRRPSYSTSVSSPTEGSGTVPLGHENGGSLSAGGMHSPLATYSPSSMSSNWWSNQHFVPPPSTDFPPVSPMHWPGHEQDQVPLQQDNLNNIYHSNRHCHTSIQNGYPTQTPSQPTNYTNSRPPAPYHHLNSFIHYPQAACSSSNSKDEHPGWGFPSHHSLSTHSPEPEHHALKSNCKSLKTNATDPLISSSDTSFKGKDLIDETDIFGKGMTALKTQSDYNSPELQPCYIPPTHHHHQQANVGHPISHHKTEASITSNSVKASQRQTGNTSIRKNIAQDSTATLNQNSEDADVNQKNARSTRFPFHVEDFLCVTNGENNQDLYSNPVIEQPKERHSVIQSGNNGIEVGKVTAKVKNSATGNSVKVKEKIQEVNPSPLNRPTADKNFGYLKQKPHEILKDDIPQIEKPSKVIQNPVPKITLAQTLKGKEQSEDESSDESDSDSSKDDSDSDSDSCDLTIDQANNTEQQDDIEEDKEEDESGSNDDQNEPKQNYLNSSNFSNLDVTLDDDGDDSSNFDNSSHLTFDSAANESQSMCAGSLAGSLCEDDDVSPFKSGDKRKQQSQAVAAKRRRIATEELVKVPLTQGWKRQIRIRPSPSKDSLRGDVYYFSPNQKKFRTYPELSKYLAKENIADLSLDNFSFSTKIYVGDFLEAKEGANFEALDDEEIQRRRTIEMEKQKVNAQKMIRKKEKKRIQSEMSKKANQARVQQRLERQAALEAARESKRQKAEDKLQEKHAKQAAIEAAKQAKKERALFLSEQRRLTKERTKQQKLLEKEQRLESIRMEKERRLRSIQEVRRMKKEANQSAKKEDAIKKAQDRELKRQQAVMMKAQEKEQRKQQLIMIRALESQRKAEEREKKREVKRLEKKLLRQKKMEQKRLERQIHRELKKPIEDMALKDGKPLPDYPRVKGLNIPGKAFADLCMVEEFVHCFGHVLDIDPDGDFPSLVELQSACLSESSNEDSLFSACHSLLSAALDDPGMPPVEAVTSLGVALSDVDLTESNMTEVLRLFIAEKSIASPHEACNALLTMPLQSLSPSMKASCLAFLVNELLCSKTICREIDNSLEHISNLRKDKWTMEGDLRKLKAIVKQKNIENEKEAIDKAKKNVLNKSIQELTKEGSTNSQSTDGGDTRDKIEGEADDDDDDEEEEEEEDESDEDDDDDDDEAGDDVDGVENEEDGNDEEDDDDSNSDDNDAEADTVDALNKKVSRLEKKHSKYRSKLFIASHTLRAVCMGQDRYKRWYYILPHAGGVYVEGLESGLSIEKIPTPQPEPLAIKETVTDRPEPLIPGPKMEVEPMDINQPNKEMKPEVKNIVARNISWFSLTSKARCHEPAPSQTVSANEDDNPPPPPIVSPSVRLLNQDRSFLDSLSQQLTCNDSYTADANRDTLSSTMGGSHVTEMKDILPSYGDAQRHLIQSSAASMMDFNALIEKDPQRAAIMLELQSFEPAPIPEDKTKGWWRITDANQLQAAIKALHPRGIREKSLHKSISRHLDYATNSCRKDRPSFSLSSAATVDEDQSASLEDHSFPLVAFAIDKAILNDVEELEEKVFSASLQIKGWRLPPKVSTTLNHNATEISTFNRALEEAKKRLLAVESAVERRYLKHPFRLEKSTAPTSAGGNQTSTENADTEKQSPGCQTASPAIESITTGLQLWREAVASAQSSSQLAMCISMLNECVAWERSIMKVFCIVCRKGDNEQFLLLCDDCDRGCHTYCCQPKLASIPDEDWYCTECILMANGSDHCCVCAGSSNKRVKCGFCPRHYHLGCLEPPLHKAPRTPWACPVCKKARAKTRIDAAKEKRKGKAARKSKADQNATPVSANISNSQTSNSKSNTPTSSHTGGDSRQNRKETFKDLAPCQLMLADLERHRDSWPFLVPVNAKQFPEYYQIIKKPMDFHTMKLKLRDFAYKNKAEFVSDARLVFQNCETFNEDDSEVGVAGKNMRKYFEKRWPEVLASQRNTTEKLTPNSKSGTPKSRRRQRLTLGTEVETSPVPSKSASIRKKAIELEEVSESASSAMSSGSEEESSSSSDDSQDANGDEDEDLDIDSQS